MMKRMAISFVLALLIINYADGASAQIELLPPQLEASGNRASSGNHNLTVSAGSSVWGDQETNFSGNGNMTASFTTEGLDVSVTRISADNSFGYRFFESDSGTLYATFIDSSGGRKLKLIKSTNGGKTWSPPKVVYVGASSRAMIVGSGADLWLTFFAPGNRVIVAKSHDSGETFSAVDVGAPQDANSSMFPWIEVLTNGNVLVFFDSDLGIEGDWRLLVARSTDGGSTYELKQLSDGYALSPSVRAVNGAIIAVWNNNQDNTFRSVTSLDGGATWSEEVIAQDNGCCPRATAVWDDTFYLIAAWAISRTTDFGQSWSRISHGEHGHESGWDVVTNGQGLHTLRMESFSQGDAYLWRLWLNVLPHGADLVNERLLGENLTIGSWWFPNLFGSDNGLMAAWAEQDAEGRIQAFNAAISRDQGDSFSSWRVPSSPEWTAFPELALLPGLATMVYLKTTGSGEESNTSLFLAVTPDDGVTTQTLELASGLNELYALSGGYNDGYLATDRRILMGSGTEDEAIILVVTGSDEIFSDSFESGTP